jgi:membrane-anchored protein YejM (alkaline phosphatase superfamily)
MNDFEETLISNSIIKPFILKIRKVKGTKRLGFTKYDQIVKTLDELGDVANESGPKFVFYHINSPHSHYCFDENGEMVSRHPVYDFSAWMSDRRAIPGYFAWGRENYPRNVAGLNIHVTKSIQRILDESEGDAIVIVQSDHGSPYGVDPLSATKTDVVERFGILNAIFLPDKFPRADLDKKISSVNTFRLILRNVFNVNLPALENRAYYSIGDLDFEDITQRLQN